MSAGLHLIAVILLITVAWQAPWRPRYILLQPTVQPPEVLPPYGGIRSSRGPHAGLGRRTPPPPVAAIPIPTPTPPVTLPDTASPPLPSVAGRSGLIAPGPALGDGRLWVEPRPGLPAVVAAQLYPVDSLERDVAVINRLQSMVDTLNRMIDEEQRAHRLPSWTVGGDSTKPQWGIDPRYIYIAGIKIPTVALALLGDALPQGNYDEAMRARRLADMREDLLRSAQRAENFQQFRRYVRELRERKQAERDAEKRRQQRPDTVKATP